MKINAAVKNVYFNGNDKTYKKEVEEKSHTTLKLAIGTVTAGAALLAVYYLTKGKCPIKLKNGHTLTKNSFTDKDGNEIIERIFKNKNGEIYKKIKSVTSLETSAGFPVGYEKNTTIYASGCEPKTIINRYSLDMHPKSTTASNGKTFVYCYGKRTGDKIIGIAYTENNKVKLKFNNKKDVIKEFTDFKSMYEWAKGNII